MRKCLLHLGSAGKLQDLTETFQQEQVLQAPHPLYLALMTLPPHLVPQMYLFGLNTLGISPNAASIALLIRAYGELRNVAQAEAVLQDWQV